MHYLSPREGAFTPRVGFTYFGQLVGHDLTHDATGLDAIHPHVDTIPNLCVPRLNLEPIYGGGPAHSPELFEGPSGAETFKVGRSKNGRGRDLPLSSGKLLIADDRNLDNVIIRQLHVLFLKFHNEAIKQLKTGSLIIHGADSHDQTLFEKARRLVQWHYQWIVRHDYLPRVLHNQFWFTKSPVASAPSFSIPVEFSLAAYRFGHSMVRPAYGLNCRTERAEISELMSLGNSAAPIDDNYLVEWGRFFDGLPHSGPVASSLYLDTSISSALHSIPMPVLELCIHSESAQTPQSLPVRTLLRGARAWLPSGQEVAAFFRKKALLSEKDELTEEQLTRDRWNDSGTVLRQIELHRNTPLFYYILKEAEVLGNGQTLGPLGSLLVGRVVLEAMQSDPDSYLSKIGSQWELPKWRFHNGSVGVVNSIIGIIRLVGDHKLLPECDAKWRTLQPVN